MYGIEQLKMMMRSSWVADDFGQIAKYSEPAAEEFVQRLPIQADMRVLDGACGSGNLAIPAARRGPEVTGIDIASNLIEQALTGPYNRFCMNRILSGRL